MHGYEQANNIALDLWELLTSVSPFDLFYGLVLVHGLMLAFGLVLTFGLTRQSTGIDSHL